MNGRGKECMVIERRRRRDECTYTYVSEKGRDRSVRREREMKAEKAKRERDE